VPMRKQPMDFSNAENPWGHARRVEKAIRKNFLLVSHYPERGHDALIEALAKHHDLPTDCIFVGNGATGCIQNVVMAFVRNGDHVALPELSFPLPVFAATAMGGGGLKVPMHGDFRIDFGALRRSVNKRTGLVFLCNPNNPTGLFEKPDVILDFAKRVKVPVLVSEASIEFAGASLFKSFPAWPDNLIVVRTFSKAHGLAGLRIGFGAAKPELVRKIMRFQLPFAVSRLSGIAAIAALNETRHVRDSAATMRKEREFLCRKLADMGFDVLPPESNLLLAKLPSCVASTKNFISGLERARITVLNGAAFSSLLRRHIRISPRTRVLNKAFVAAIAKLLKKRNEPD
ncbi:MAG TPA: histidinol-phosphate transaminase, partial [Alphaproteobacteria bacterium]|nr:histidinol-phosphate transaminase [Alphaproteobacteria bacterium]